MLIDCHCHMDLIYENKAYNDINFSDFEKIITVSHNFKSFVKNFTLSLENEKLIPAIGLHPQNVKNNFSDLAKISEMIEKVKILSEIGLDHFFIRDKSEWFLQEKVFRYFLFFAEKNKLRLNIHSIGAEKEILDILDSFNIPKVIFHWFNGNFKEFKKIQDKNYFISFGPAILISKKIQLFAKDINISNILTESDAPYHYKDIEFSLNKIHEVVRKIAALKSNNRMELEEQICENLRCFLKE